MTLARSDEELEQITNAMRDFVTPFITPLFYADEAEKTGRPGGTGNFIRVGNGTCILTNYHVINEKGKALLAYLTGNGRSAVAIASPFSVLFPPRDAGIVRVLDSLFVGDEKCPLSPTLFGESQDLTDELLFIQGFPERGPNNEIMTSFSPFLPGIQAQALGITTVFRSDEGEVTFDVDFRHRGFQSKDMVISHMGHPGGFSGSLVWNCRFQPDSGWSPNRARVVGLVKKWDDKRETFMCTRVEIVKGFISKFALKEAAYYRWLNNGRLENSALSDWLWAEQNNERLIFGDE